MSKSRVEMGGADADVVTDEITALLVLMKTLSPAVAVPRSDEVGAVTEVNQGTVSVGDDLKKVVAGSGEHSSARPKTRAFLDDPT